MKNSESKKKNSNKPLVIYVGEQHDNMAYGSLIEQIVEDCEKKGLKVQVFSEFETQTQKINLEEKLGEPLRNKPDDLAEFTKTTKFLDDHFIKMGDLNEREKIMAESLQKYQELGLTPRQMYEQTKSQMVVAPEVYGLMEGDLKEGEKTGSVNGKPFSLESFYHGYRAQFNHEAIHGAMLEDFRSARKPETDVIVLISGLGHTYGLNQELSELEGCKKFVVTNFLDFLPLEQRTAIRNNEESAKIGTGGLLEFDVNPVSKEAVIPEVVKLEIDARSQVKSEASKLSEAAKLTGFSVEEISELHKPKIALITPGLSGDTDGSTIEQDAEKLKSLGFRVEFLPGSVSNSHPFVGAKIANTAEQRARQVINFAQDPEVVAMWAVNGGESCPEVAKLLVEYGKDPQKYLEKHQVDCVSGEILGYAAGAENGFPKDRLLPTIVGMSDVSSIQLSLAQFGFPSHYGSVSLANVEHLQRMSEAVQKGTASELEQITQISRQDAPEKMSGTVYATVNGGLESSLHTDWQPKFPPNTVLMIEGVSGYDAIASTLNKAKQAGALANVSAILVGNPVDPGQGINPESRERFTKFAGEFDLPIFSVGGNQFGHLAGKEPTSIANFGNIEIDTRLGTARIEQGSVRENILQFHAEKVAAPRVEFEAQQLGINPLALELTSINQHPIPTELTDVVGGKGRSLPMHSNLAGKTLLVDYSNWVELGRQMTDIANRGELESVKAIIFSVDNHYPELKSRFDSATSEQEKVAVGLSFVTHPDFKFSHNSENTYRCDNATKERAEISFIPWLKSRGIELEAKDILVDGEGITFPIPIERNSEIIAQVTNEKSIGFVRQSAGRAEYFAKQHPEIPVFLTDRSNLPEVMRGPLFSAERLEVLQNKSEKETDERFAKKFSGDKKAKEFEDIGSDSKKSWVDRISNSNQSRDDSVMKR